METTPRSEMRILTVRQPWAWAIVHGGKDVENRLTNIAGAYRGPVAIHVAGKYAVEYLGTEALQEAQMAWCEAAGYHREHEDPWFRGVGSIIGVVDLTDAHLCVGECSPWALPTMQDERGDWWHLQLRNARPLAEPIPYRGALGLRRLDDDTTARILAQIGGDA